MPFHRTAAAAGLVAVLAVVGCQRVKTPPPAPPPPKVTVTRPATAPITDYWEYNGHLDTMETVEVRARVKGFLNAIHFKEGTEVQKDDLLYEIDKREYLTAQAKAKAELEKAKADTQNWAAQIKLAKADLGRVEQGRTTGVFSQTDIDKAKATVEVDEAQHAAALAAEKSAASALHTTEIQLGYTEVKAKIGGQIGRTAVDVGNLVGQSEPTLLTTIIRVDKLYAMFDVPERDVLEYLREAEKLKLPVPPEKTIPFSVRLPGENQDWIPGEIDYVEASVNPGTGTARARGIIENPRRNPSSVVRAMFPGMYIQVRVPKPRPANVPFPIIPEDCLMTGQLGRFVYVVRPDNTVEVRTVTVGPTVWRTPPPAPGVVPPRWVLFNPTPKAPAPDAPPEPTQRDVRSMVAITSGLKPEDRVIVDGLQKVRPNSPADPQEWNLRPPTEPAKK